MLRRTALLTALLTLCCVLGQTGELRPRVLRKTIEEGRVLELKLGASFATAIHMPEPVSSVVVGDPTRFKVEHSEKEARLVFVKTVSSEAAETNLLISTTSGRHLNLLLRSIDPTRQPESVDREVHLFLDYQPHSGFVIDPGNGQSVPLTETVSLDHPVEAIRSQPPGTQAPTVVTADPLEKLLIRQRHAILPRMTGGSLRAGIGEIFEDGPNILVLFSVAHFGREAIELMPPQVQLRGVTGTGKIVRRSRVYVSEQLPIAGFRFSSRRLESKERIDGVAMFEKPMFKQLDQTLYLQISSTNAVDKPVLVPIHLGSSHPLKGVF